MAEPQQRDDGDFELDSTCELAGPLTVEIGEGEQSFSLLADGEEPDFHTAGGFQGGVSQHYYLALTVGDVAPERYDRLLVEVETYAVGECPDDGLPCGTSDWGQTFVLGGPDQRWTLDDGQVVETGIFMPHYDQVMVQVTVTDPCNRVGWAQHRW